MKKAFLLSVFVSISLFQAKAQDTEVSPCSAWEMQEKIIKNDPATAISIENEIARINKDQQSVPKRNKVDVRIIPVVFHVIHANGSENISEAQVHDAIASLNEEFRAKNAAVKNVVPTFKDRVGDSNIEFRLATLDPAGNPTNGITRHVDANTVGADDGVKTGRQWPSNKYLNIYTCKTIGSGAAGYAYFPGAGAAIDGILIIHAYVGRTGTGSSGRSSALTHEVGHYLSLFHAWGPGNTPADPNKGNCFNDDNVDDTPNTNGNQQCNLNANTCDVGSPGDEIDNVQNFMEYAYCYAMFTQGQADRMNAAMEGVYRKPLWQTSNLKATGADYNGQPTTLYLAQFSSNSTDAICANTSIAFKDESFFSPTAWNWDFPGGTPSSSTEQNPVITYLTPGVYDVSLTVTNSSGTLTKIKEEYITVTPGGNISTPYLEKFETIQIPNNDFVSINEDGDNQEWIINSSVGYDDTKSIYIANRQNAINRKDLLEIGAFDITNMTSPRFGFKLAYASKTASNNDVLNVYVSSNCGITYSKRLSLSTSLMRSTADFDFGNFAPANQSEWKSFEVSLNNFKSTATKVKLEWISGGGNNVYADNLVLYDAAITSVSQTKNESGVTISPNPSNGNFTFSANDDAVYSVDIIDITGKKLTSLKSVSGKLDADLSNYPKGIYIALIKSNNAVFSEKLILGQ